MRTFINLKPDETRSCIGCHEDRRQAPQYQAQLPMARLSTPIHPMPQPGDTVASRPLHYPSDIQPVFDNHCVRCHGGDSPKGKLDLSGKLTTLFSRSYEELIDKGHVKGFNEWNSNPSDVLPLAPYAVGSHKSKLITLLRKGHNQVKLSQPEFVRLATWMDLNIPYYGSYYGKRNIKYKDEPGFRPIPTLSSACGLPDTP